MTRPTNLIEAFTQATDRMTAAAGLDPQDRTLGDVVGGGGHEKELEALRLIFSGYDEIDPDEIQQIQNGILEQAQLAAQQGVNVAQIIRTGFVTGLYAGLRMRDDR